MRKISCKGANLLILLYCLLQRNFIHFSKRFLIPVWYCLTRKWWPDRTFVLSYFIINIQFSHFIFTHPSCIIRFSNMHRFPSTSPGHSAILLCKCCPSFQIPSTTIWFTFQFFWCLHNFPRFLALKRTHALLLLDYINYTTLDQRPSWLINYKRQRGNFYLFLFYFFLHMDSKSGFMCESLNHCTGAFSSERTENNSTAWGVRFDVQINLIQ